MTNKELLEKYIKEYYCGPQLSEIDKQTIYESIGFARFKLAYHVDVMAKALKEDICEATLKAKEAFDKFSQQINNN